MRVLLIIPAYNEEANILKVISSIKKYNQSTPPRSKLNYIVINDCSTDSTSQICHKHHIPIIDLPHNLGIGGAVQTGYKYAREQGYDVAVQFDGDGQHNVNYVKNIVKPIKNKQADMVIGSRFLDKNIDTFKSSAMRRFGIKIISNLIRLITGQKILDTTSGFRACNKSVIREFAEHYPTKYPEPITTATLIKQDYRVQEVPVSMNARAGGTSSITTWKSAYYMINVCFSLLALEFRGVSHHKKS